MECFFPPIWLPVDCCLLLLVICFVSSIWLKSIKSLCCGIKEKRNCWIYWNQLLNCNILLSKNTNTQKWTIHPCIKPAIYLSIIIFIYTHTVEVEPTRPDMAMCLVMIVRLQMRIPTHIRVTQTWHTYTHTHAWINTNTWAWESKSSSVLAFIQSDDDTTTWHMQEYRSQTTPTSLF